MRCDLQAALRLHDGEDEESEAAFRVASGARPIQKVARLSVCVRALRLVTTKCVLFKDENTHDERKTAA